mmetsp:Transcript_13055/g.19942  ORF Transcript_13055/g.19942 Transcript_13055/m.19942 type:complete len:269 (-) Transcript_13055:786-1592(-)
MPAQLPARCNPLSVWFLAFQKDLGAHVSTVEHHPLGCVSEALLAAQAPPLAEQRLQRGHGRVHNRAQLLRVRRGAPRPLNVRGQLGGGGLVVGQAGAAAAGDGLAAGHVVGRRVRDQAEVVLPAQQQQVPVAPRRRVRRRVLQPGHQQRGDVLVRGVRRRRLLAGPARPGGTLRPAAAAAGGLGRGQRVGGPSLRGGVRGGAGHLLLEPLHEGAPPLGLPRLHLAGPQQVDGVAAPPERLGAAVPLQLPAVRVPLRPHRACRRPGLGH